MGIVLNAKPKPALRALVGTQPQQSVYFSAESNGASAEIGEFNDFSGFSESDDQSESDAEEDDDDYETFNYLAEIEVNTIVWPSIVGQLDIDEIEDDYIVEGSLKLPNGVVTIKDRLAIPVRIVECNVHVSSCFLAYAVYALKFPCRTTSTSRTH